MLCRFFAIVFRAIFELRFMLYVHGLFVCDTVGTLSISYLRTYLPAYPLLLILLLLEIHIWKTYVHRIVNTAEEGEKKCPSPARACAKRQSNQSSIALASFFLSKMFSSSLAPIKKTAPSLFSDLLRI